MNIPSQLTALFYWLTTPLTSFKTPQELLRARAFLTATLLTIVIASITLTLYIVVYPDNESWQIIFLYIVLYGICRFVSYPVGKYLLTLLMSALAVLVVVFNPTIFSVEVAFMVLLITFILTSIHSSFRTLVWVGLFDFFVMVLMLPPILTLEEFSITLWYGFMFVVGMLILTLSFYLENQDRHLDNPNASTLVLLDDFWGSYGYRLKVNATKQLQLLWVSGAFKNITGYTFVQAQRLLDWRKVIYAEDLVIFDSMVETVTELGEASAEYRILQPDGAIRWISDKARLVEKKNGETTVLGVIQDTHDRIIAEEALKAHIVQQAVVAELGLLALVYDDIKPLVDHATVLCEQVLDATLVEVLVYNSANSTFTLLGSTNDFRRYSEPFSSTIESTPYGDAIKAQEMVVVTSIPKHPRYGYVDFFVSRGITSTVSVVIHSEDQPFGVLNVHSIRERQFSDDDVYFLQSIANVISAFYERTRSKKSEQEQSSLADAMREATALLVNQFDLQVVLDKILDFITQIMPNQEACTLMLLNDGTKKMHFVSQHGYSEDLKNDDKHGFHIAWDSKYTKMLEKGYYIIDDVKNSPDWHSSEVTNWVRSYLGALIMFNGECIGLINVDSSKIGAFTEKDGKNLQAFADKAGIAIQNAKRAEELERLVEERTKQLRFEQEQMQAILDATGEGIYYTEMGRVLYANQALFNMTGYRREELIGKRSIILHPNRDNTERIYVSALDIQTILKTKIWRDEGNMVRKDGSEFVAGLTTSRLENQDGVDHFRAVTVVRDISRQKELESQQKRFIANAAHELRSPITNLNTRLYLIEKNSDNMPDHVEKLKLVINRMNRLVSDLLDMSYIEHGRIALQKQVILLQDLIIETVRLLEADASLKNIALKLELSENPISVLGDPHRLQQVFTNLIMNAINYTSIDGTITVKANATIEEVVVAIVDTGKGIPPENLSMIFEPFYRVETKQTGTGLGLSIAQEIAQLHGGKITVESELGVGSTFYVRLPYLE